MKKLVLLLISMFALGASLQAQTQQEVDSLFKVGDYTKAVAIMNQMDSIAKEKRKAERKSEAYVQDAKWYFNRGIYDKAADMIDKALIYNPEAREIVKFEGIIDTEKMDAMLQLGNNKWWNRFSFGVAIGGDFLSVSGSGRVGLSVKYGYYRDLVNVVLGVEYNCHLAFENRYDLGKKGMDVIGSQIAIPLWAKFNLLNMSNSSRLYLGAGAEYGIRLTARQNYTGKYYPTEMIAMPSSSIAGLVHVGLTMRHMDVGLYYKGYFDDIVIPPYYHYMENSRVGVNVAYYF